MPYRKKDGDAKSGLSRPPFASPSGEEKASKNNLLADGSENNHVQSKQTVNQRLVVSFQNGLGRVVIEDAFDIFGRNRRKATKIDVGEEKFRRQ